jgi:solute carrier family 25 phosphate transporter 23/24/25/41
MHSCLLDSISTTVYQVRKRFADGRGAARVNMDGDLSVSFPKTTVPPTSSSGSATTSSSKTSGELADCQAREASLVDGHEDCGVSGSASVDAARIAHPEEEEEEADDHMEFNRHVAWKFLLAGGVAGAGKP